MSSLPPRYEELTVTDDRGGVYALDLSFVDVEAYVPKERKWVVIGKPNERVNIEDLDIDSRNLGWNVPNYVTIPSKANREIHYVVKIRSMGSVEAVRDYLVSPEADVKGPLVRDGEGKYYNILLNNVVIEVLLSGRRTSRWMEAPEGEEVDVEDFDLENIKWVKDNEITIPSLNSDRIRYNAVVTPMTEDEEAKLKERETEKRIADLERLISQLSKHVFYPTNKTLKYDKEGRLVTTTNLIYKDEPLNTLINSMTIALGDYERLPEVIESMAISFSPSLFLCSFLKGREIDDGYYKDVREITLTYSKTYIDSNLGKPFTEIFSEEKLRELNVEPGKSQLSDGDGSKTLYTFYYELRDSPNIREYKRMKLGELIHRSIELLFSHLPKLKKITFNVPKDVRDLMFLHKFEVDYNVTYIP